MSLLDNILPGYRVCSLPIVDRSQITNTEVYLRVCISIVDMCYLDPYYLLLHSGLLGFNIHRIDNVVKASIRDGYFTKELELTPKGSSHIISLYEKLENNLKAGSKEEKRIETLLTKVNEMLETYLQGGLLDAKEKLCLKLIYEVNVAHTLQCNYFDTYNLRECNCQAKEVEEFREHYKNV